MGIGDCVFWSIICLVAITFVWLKFIEPFVSIWFSLVASSIVALLIFVRGGRPGRSGKGKKVNG
jgi:predicted small integral membrane protein